MSRLTRMRAKGLLSPSTRLDPQPIDPCDAFHGPDLGIVAVGFGDRCRVTVSIDLVDCTWQEAWGSESYGPITLRQTYCVDGT